ncbi:hypothetical protein IAR55_003311 [Kwoniella newhampshirensis]|uniref:Uncharacterized protein n=1 Tax=Kwoniella newhampshirensis TaxID=1651941 RepID=A0AAW0YYF1_9TREE
MSTLTPTGRRTRRVAIDTASKPRVSISLLTSHGRRPAENRPLLCSWTAARTPLRALEPLLDRYSLNIKSPLAHKKEEKAGKVAKSCAEWEETIKRKNRKTHDRVAPNPKAEEILIKPDEKKSDDGLLSRPDDVAQKEAGVGAASPASNPIGSIPQYSSSNNRKRKRSESLASESPLPSKRRGLSDHTRTSTIPETIQNVPVAETPTVTHSIPSVLAESRPHHIDIPESAQVSALLPVSGIDRIRSAAQSSGGVPFTESSSGAHLALPGSYPVLGPATSSTIVSASSAPDCQPRKTADSTLPSVFDVKAAIPASTRTFTGTSCPTLTPTPTFQSTTPSTPSITPSSGRMRHLSSDRDSLLRQNSSLQLRLRSLQTHLSQIPTLNHTIYKNHLRLERLEKELEAWKQSYLTLNDEFLDLKEQHEILKGARMGEMMRETEVLKNYNQVWEERFHREYQEKIRLEEELQYLKDSS